VDLAGFAKAGARWFQAWWLYGGDDSNPLWAASRPTLPAGEVVHIVEKNLARLDTQASGMATTTKDGSQQHTIHVYSSASTVELELNGASLGVRSNAQWMGWMEWNISSSSGSSSSSHRRLPPSEPEAADVHAAATTTLRAVARNASGAIVATHSRVASSPTAAIVLSLDAPSPSTGTGHRVVLDGHDVALVRATVVDASGHPGAENER
jgi:hypothetical protein